MRVWLQFLGVSLGLIPVLLLAAMSLWLLHGGRILAVQTASMAPIFRPGDAVLVQPVSLARLRVGDIVSYRSSTQPGTIVSHRLLRRISATSFVMQGDRLAQPDPQVVASQIVGRVAAVAPRLGGALHWLRQPLGLAVTVYLPVLSWLAYECRRYLRATPRVYQAHR